VTRLDVVGRVRLASCSLHAARFGLAVAEGGYLGKPVS